jgi:hypothetical protein
MTWPLDSRAGRSGPVSAGRRVRADSSGGNVPQPRRVVVPRRAPVTPAPPKRRPANSKNSGRRWIGKASLLLNPSLRLLPVSPVNPRLGARNTRASVEPDSNRRVIVPVISRARPTILGLPACWWRRGSAGGHLARHWSQGHDPLDFGLLSPRRPASIHPPTRGPAPCAYSRLPRSMTGWGDSRAPGRRPGRPTKRPVRHGGRGCNRPPAPRKRSAPQGTNRARG